MLLQIHEENSGNALNECLSVPRCPKPTFLRFVGDLWIFASSSLIAGMKFDRTFYFFPSLYDVRESSSSSVMWWLPEERCVWRVPTGVDQGTHVPEDPSGINPDTMVWNRFFRSQTPSLIWVAAFDKGFLLKSVCGFFLGCSLGANFASGETPLWHVLNVFFLSLGAFLSGGLQKQKQNREVGLFNRGGGGRSIFCRGRFFICPVVVFPCERCGFVPTNNRKQQTKIENWRS